MSWLSEWLKREKGIEEVNLKDVEKHIRRKDWEALWKMLPAPFREWVLSYMDKRELPKPPSEGPPVGWER